MEKYEAEKLAGLKPLPGNFFRGDVEEVAKALIGTFLFTTHSSGNNTGGMIVETEAYDESDPAAHCHTDADKTRLKLSGSMRLKGGHAYVYSYRLNNSEMWCLNFSSGMAGVGSAILIRAVPSMRNRGYATAPH